MPTIAPERHPKRFTKRNWKGTGPKILEMQRRLKAKRERNVDIDIEDEDTVPEPFFLAPSTPTSDNPIGWPFAGYDPAQPFRFHDCPKHVRQLILHHAIYTKSFIRPRYNVGSVQTTPSATENLINFDTSLWLAVGNKRFYYAASAAFYGTSMFKFKDPALAFWYVFHIQNVK